MEFQLYDNDDEYYLYDAGMISDSVLDLNKKVLRFSKASFDR